LGRLAVAMLAALAIAPTVHGQTARLDPGERPVSSRSADRDPVPVRVLMSPSAVTLRPGEAQQLQAVAMHPLDRSVSWSLAPPVGTISSGGLYTAPATVSGTQTVTVRATSVAEPAASATASITLKAPSTMLLTPATVTSARPEPAVHGLAGRE